MFLVDTEPIVTKLYPRYNKHWPRCSQYKQHLLKIVLLGQNELKSFQTFSTSIGKEKDENNTFLYKLFYKNQFTTGII